MMVKAGGSEVDKARKEVIKIFEHEDVRVTTECNTTIIDFLDIILDLRSRSFRPFIKPIQSMSILHIGPIIRARCFIKSKKSPVGLWGLFQATNTRF